MNRTGEEGGSRIKEKMETKELKKGMTEQANIMVPGFNDVMKCLLEQKK